MIRLRLALRVLQNIPQRPLRVPRPVERESQEIEGRRTFAALLPRRRTPEGKKPRLVRMQGQSEAPQPLAEPWPSHAAHHPPARSR